MEILSTSRWLLPASVGGIVIGIVGTLGVQSLNRNSDRETKYSLIYTSSYTGPDGCLQGTPFDPTEEAQINFNNISQVDVMSVVPRAANSYKPSVLFFVAEDGRLSPADFYTAGFLEQSHCKGLPSGS